MTLATIPANTPAISDAGMIHKTEMPINPKNAIDMANPMLANPPMHVPDEVANGIYKAMKNKTKSGATNKLTTLMTTSNRLPSTWPTNILKINIPTPMIMDKKRICLI